MEFCLNLERMKKNVNTSTKYVALCVKTKRARLVNFEDQEHRDLHQSKQAANSAKGDAECIVIHTYAYTATVVN